MDLIPEKFSKYNYLQNINKKTTTVNLEEPTNEKLKYFLESLSNYTTNTSRKIWFLSDTHFGHLNCYIKFEPSRVDFGNTFEVFETNLIDSWNSHIDKNDIVVHLGDFCINKHNPKMSKKNIQTYSNLLNGFKVLIKGNHDKESKEVYLESGWDVVIDKPLHYNTKTNILTVFEIPNNMNFCGSLMIDLLDRKVLMSHLYVYNFDLSLEANRYLVQCEFLNTLFEHTNCDLNIHGHAHSHVKNSMINFNVSVENIDFKPVLLNRIIILDF